MQESTQAALGICRGKRREYLSSKFQHSCQGKNGILWKINFPTLGPYVAIYACFDFYIYVLNCPPPAVKVWLWDYGGSEGLDFNSKSKSYNWPSASALFQAAIISGKSNILIKDDKTASWLFLKHHRGRNHRLRYTYICISPSAHVTLPPFHLLPISCYKLTISHFGRNHNKPFCWTIHLRLFFS